MHKKTPPKPNPNITISITQPSNKVFFFPCKFTSKENLPYKLWAFPPSLRKEKLKTQTQHTSLKL